MQSYWEKHISWIGRGRMRIEPIIVPINPRKCENCLYLTKCRKCRKKIDKRDAHLQDELKDVWLCNECYKTRKLRIKWIIISLIIFGIIMAIGILTSNEWIMVFGLVIPLIWMSIKEQ